MAPFRQDIRFAQTPDHLRIAYAVSGQGYPLVRAATWMSNVELDWRTETFGPLFRELSARYKLHILPGLQHGYMMRANISAFDQQAFEFSIARASSILHGLRTRKGTLA